MIVNVIGECDTRPVLFAAMKIMQEIGDVLLLTNSSKLLRLSDTGESGGHYQNVMIGVTTEGVDDFFYDFKYTREDFDFVLIDGIVDVGSNLTIYVEGMSQSSDEKYMLASIKEYKTIRLYKGKIIEANTPYKMEQFEALRDMCPMTPKVIKAVAELLSPLVNITPNKLIEVANKQSYGAAPSKDSPKGQRTKPSLFNFGK